MTDTASHSHVMNTYARLPISVVRGEGCYLYDLAGNRYFDSISGIGVCSLGHSHPEIASAISEQAKTLVHASNLAKLPVQEQLADTLARLSGLDAAFFCNSGAEALECAFKIARRHGHAKGVVNPAIAVVSQSFHGRTLACLSATDSEKIQYGFAPLVEGFRRFPFGDAGSIAHAVKADSSICAILCEPILGEGGVVIPPPGYLAELRRIADQHGLLLMVDEVQTGIAKTGDFFAFHAEGILPDVVSCAKALGNGVPIGACLARQSVAQLLPPGSHGSTYGGNPLACAAANKVLEVIERDEMCSVAQHSGAFLLEQLRSGLSAIDAVIEVRGRGMMIGVELDRPATGLVPIALESGLIMNVTRDKVIRLLPPLVASRDEISLLADTLTSLVKSWLTE